MNTAQIKEALRENGIQVNRRLGQNFLCNETVIERIVQVSSIKAGDTVLEIGPGLGEMTAHLLRAEASVTAVEIDAGLVRFLSKRFEGASGLTLVHSDFLKLAPSADFPTVISNLPYYCSSEILFRLATAYRAERIFVMLQREMAERIYSEPGTDNYGALSVALQYYYVPRFLFTIDRSSFYPQPDVVSSFISLERRGDIPDDAGTTELFHRIVKSSFWGRRKTLVKSLAESPHLDFSRDEIAGALRSLGIDERTRGENLGVEDFKRLSAALLPAVR